VRVPGESTFGCCVQSPQTSRHLTAMVTSGDEQVQPCACSAVSQLLRGQQGPGATAPASVPVTTTPGRAGASGCPAAKGTVPQRELFLREATGLKLAISRPAVVVEHLAKDPPGTLPFRSQFHYTDYAWHREKLLWRNAFARIASRRRTCESSAHHQQCPADSADHPTAKIILQIDPITSM